MESNTASNLFNARGNQVVGVKNSIDFGLGKERWQHPELGAKWSSWLKENEGSYKDKEEAKKDASYFYNLDLFKDIISKNKNIDFEDGLLNEGQNINEEIMTYYGLKKDSDITPDLKTEFIAGTLANNRFDKDLTNQIYGKAFGIADNFYSKNENDPFAYIPQFQNQSPSRASLLNTGHQSIDTSVPAFLQARNPFFNSNNDSYNPLLTGFYSEEKTNPNSILHPEVYQKRLEAFNRINQQTVYPKSYENGIIPSVVNDNEISRMRATNNYRLSEQQKLIDQWKRGEFNYPSER